MWVVCAWCITTNSLRVGWCITTNKIDNFTPRFGRSATKPQNSSFLLIYWNIDLLPWFFFCRYIGLSTVLLKTINHSLFGCFSVQCSLFVWQTLHLRIYKHCQIIGIFHLTRMPAIHQVFCVGAVTTPYIVGFFGHFYTCTNSRFEKRAKYHITVKF